MADNKVNTLLDQIGGLSVLELNDLVKALEEKFGVSAQPLSGYATPAGQAAQGSEAGAGEANAPDQTVFNVVLTGAGANKIGVIKAVRELNPVLGLKEAKDLVEACPKDVLTAVNKATATEAKQKLEAAGATVELK